MRLNAEIVQVYGVRDEEGEENSFLLELRIPGQSVGPGTFLGAEDILISEFLKLNIGDMITIETEEGG